MNVLRQSRPLDGERRRDDRALSLIEMSEELRQKLPSCLELESQRTPNPEIISQRATQRLHEAPPGHLCASDREGLPALRVTGHRCARSRNLSRSTFA